MTRWKCPTCEHVNAEGRECVSCGHEQTRAELLSSRVESWGLGADASVRKLYRGSDPAYVAKSMLDRLVGPIGWIAAAILVLSILPFVSPLFVFELPDLTQALVDGCAPGSEVESEVDCGTRSWLRLVAVARDDYGLHMALDPAQGQKGDWLRLELGSGDYILERGTDGVWIVERQADPEFETIGVGTKTQNGLEVLALPLAGDVDRWAVSTSRSRVPRSGMHRTSILSTLTDSVSIPKWGPWALLAGLIVWGFRAGSPARVVDWARWIMLMSMIGWALSGIKPHLDQAMGRFAESVNYPVVVPIGLGVVMAIGVPWLAFVIARSLARQLPRWSILSDRHSPRPSDTIAVKIVGAVTLVLFTYVAVMAIDAGVARLFPGFTI